MNFSYDREAELREKFNQFIANKVTGVNEDYSNNGTQESLYGYLECR